MGITLAKNRKISKKKFFFENFFREKFGLWVGSWGTEKCKKNAKFGCFDHLGFHQIHVFEQSYTEQWLDKAIFDQRKNNFFAQNWPW